jgi:penicillin G amidase
MLPLLFLLSCGGDTPTSLLDDVAATESWSINGLTCPVHVVRTELGVPHVYAANRADLARVQGFVVARDRYFFMEIARRLGLGTVSALLGDGALETDMESRGTGMTHVADHLLDGLDEDQLAWFDAFAAGVNDYVIAAQAETLPVPTEFEIFAPILGLPNPADLLELWDRRDIAGMAAVIVYNLGYETTDVGNQDDQDRLVGQYDGVALEDLRKAGLYADIVDRVDPVYPLSSTLGWGLNGAGAVGPSAAKAHIPGKRVALPQELLTRARTRLEKIDARLGHDHEAGWGSNAWAVTADAADGGSLLAGDGHLPLTVPNFFFQMGLDTALLGGGDTHQLGLFIPGLPVMAVGTNGDVAWSQTQIMGDITDWYAEELTLDADGVPITSLFQGEQRDLVAFEETYEVADVPLLNSIGRTETWTRWATFDGRWITQIEGRAASQDEALADGEILVNLLGDFMVPGDTDGDGVVSAISFDYAGLDANMITAVDGFGHAADVAEFRDSSRDLVAFSQNLVVSDAAGSVLYAPFQAIPCRGQLPRGAGGRWADGADPALLLDGTTYGAFEIPVEDGRVVFDSTDPDKCVVPFEDYPAALDPDAGYLLTANHDVAGLTLDNDLLDEPWWIGGPWVSGVRAHTIDQALTAHVAAGTATVETMQDLQADQHSAVGVRVLPSLLDAISLARAYHQEGELDLDQPAGRLAALYGSDPAGMDEAESRLSAWFDRGLHAASGVETFYSTPAGDDLDDAVATSIHAAWSARFFSAVFDDEALPGVWNPTGRTGRERTLLLMLDGRGPDNSTGLASWNPDTEESVYFDVLGTDDVETSDEVALVALLDALDFLRSADDGDGKGGFNTDDMAGWLWGLRHWVHFDSVLEELLGGDEYAGLIEQFSITTRVLPLATGLEVGDPRRDLPGFPRPGDIKALDAANFSGSGTDFTYASGPVFRMVIRLSPDGVSGVNVLPGGQSGITSSDNFSDQAELWLGNEAMPLWFSPEDVVAHGVSREIYVPAVSTTACP